MENNFLGTKRSFQNVVPRSKFFPLRVILTKKGGKKKKKKTALLPLVVHPLTLYNEHKLNSTKKEQNFLAL